LAGVFAHPAADTFGRIGLKGGVELYLTGFAATATGNTFIFVAAHLDKSDSIEQGIKRSQRAKRPTEEAVYRSGQDEKDKGNNKL
jgi:hypothetical protein